MINCKVCKYANKKSGQARIVVCAKKRNFKPTLRRAMGASGHLRHHVCSLPSPPKKNDKHHFNSYHLTCVVPVISRYA